jgi:DNA-binding response OmpR family regulator
MNGLQLVREIHKTPNKDLALIPTTMLTARQSEQGIIHGLKTGVND